MFFYPSKLFWFLAAPTNFLTLLALAGAVLCFTRFARAGRWAALSGAAGLLACGLGPVGYWLMRPLEDRFPKPPPPAEIAGIIVLGGAVGTTRGEISLNDAAARMTESASLARRHPNARLVFTGGDASLVDEPSDNEARTEAEAARRLYLSLGVPESQLVLEDRSRNTRENAVFTRELVQPKPGETWLLITSAWHMPRSVGVFRQAGFAVVPYPVDYTTRGIASDWFRLSRGFSNTLQLTDLAAKEWIGLIAYRLVGYTDALIPAPSPATPAGTRP